jgi:hypothetical protein
VQFLLQVEQLTSDRVPVKKSPDHRTIWQFPYLNHCSETFPILQGGKIPQFGRLVKPERAGDTRIMTKIQV